MNEKKNILIIKHGAFGDLIQAEGIFKSIRKHHKGANLVLLTSEKFYHLMKKCPSINQIIFDNRPSFIKIWFYIILYKRINSYNFSIIYDLQNSQRTHIYRKFLFCKTKWISTDRKNHHISGLMGLSDMLQENSIDNKYAMHPEISWLSGDVENLLSKNKIFSKYIVLLPGSSRKNMLKRWPYYRKLTMTLILKGYEVLTILGPEELDLEKSTPGHVFKDLDWSQLAGLIEKSFFVVGNDSGPCHIASCLNKDGIAIFGNSTSASRSELKREKFDTLEVDNLNNLTVECIMSKINKLTSSL